MADAEAPEPDDGRHSNFRLEISIAVGYQRKRTTMAGKWEGPLVTIGLLVVGSIVVLFVFWRLSLIAL